MTVKKIRLVTPKPVKSVSDKPNTSSLLMPKWMDDIKGAVGLRSTNALRGKVTIQKILNSHKCDLLEVRRIRFSTVRHGMDKWDGTVYLYITTEGLYWKMFQTSYYDSMLRPEIPENKILFHQLEVAEINQADLSSVIAVAGYWKSTGKISATGYVHPGWVNKICDKFGIKPGNCISHGKSMVWKERELGHKDVSLKSYKAYTKIGKFGQVILNAYIYETTQGVKYFEVRDRRWLTDDSPEANRLGNDIYEAFLHGNCTDVQI